MSSLFDLNDRIFAAMDELDAADPDSIEQAIRMRRLIDDDSGHDEEIRKRREAEEAEIKRRAWKCTLTPAFILLLLAGFLMNVVC